jgi:aryl-alcohol dehydrogenase-like predicted oxidoreductase
MKTVKLGTADVEVSVFCLGTMRFGWGTEAEMSYRLLDMYVDSGGSFLDTANIYGRSEGQRTGAISEMLLGAWMRERRNRSDVFVATKVGFGYIGTDPGLRARQVIDECEKSLQRLGTDRIDLFYAHVDDRETPMEETLEAFDRLVQAGKVRYVGASNFLAWRLEEARWISLTNDWVAYCCVQQRHSFIRPKHGASFGAQIVANDDLLDYSRARGLTVLAYSPLLSGAYTRSDRPFAPQYVGPDTDARVSVLEDVAKELSATPNQVVLAWMVQNDPPVIPLVAASTIEQMEENLGALELTLNADQMDRLNNAAA